VLFSARNDIDHKPERWGLIGATPKIPANHEVNPGQIALTVPKGTLNGSTFDRWNSFLREQDFGIFSIWLSLTDHSEQKDDSNDLGDWTASIDFFAILNVDLSSRLPSLWHSPAEQAADEPETYTFKTQFFHSLYRFIHNFGFGIIARKLGEDLHRQGTRAAISQVMARNMSHNIGSHVLSKFKDEKDLNGIFGVDLREVIQSLDTRASSSNRVGNQPNQYNGEPHLSLYSKIQEGNRKGELVELSPAGQAAYFNEYLKNRMDFLADIATADPVMENAMFIYSDVFKGLDKNRILLNRISGISETEFKYSIELRSCVGSKKPERITKANDIAVSMTNDILGAQAFYIIIENLIRNIAKHGRPDRTEKAKIKIIVQIGEYEGDPEFYEVSIFDNLKRSKEKINPVVVTRNDVFNDSLLKKEDNSLRPTDLGTIEMDVCAAYMRRVPITEVESDDFRLIFGGMEEADFEQLSKEDQRRVQAAKSLGRILNYKPFKTPRTKYPKLMFAYLHRHKEEKTKGANDRYSLGYTFYLRKPQEILVVLDRERDFQVPNEVDSTSYLSDKELLGRGIRFISAKDLRRNLDGDKALVMSHQILYWHASDCYPESDWQGYATRLPKRIVTRLSSCNFIDPNDFMRQVWEKYAAELLPVRKTIAIIAGNNRNLYSGLCEKLIVETGKHLRELENVDKYFMDNHHGKWCPVCCPFNSAAPTEMHMQTHWCPDCCSSDSSPSKQHIDKAHAGNRSTCIEPWNWKYYEMGCSHAAVSRQEFKSRLLWDRTIDREEFPKGRDPGWYVSQYLETLFTKIILIDERIQENVANGESPKLYAGRVDFYEYFKKQNLIIPKIPKPGTSSDEPNLNKSSFGDLGDKNSVSGQIHDFIKNNIQDARFCVIHLGIIEKMLSSGNSKDHDVIEEKLKELLTDIDMGGCEVIITSGRGEPDNLPHGRAFVPLAPIQNAIETIFDKFILTKILYNSREARKR
jgi:hypothetical protein